MNNKAKSTIRKAGVAAAFAASAASLAGCVALQPGDISTGLGFGPSDQYDADGLATTVILATDSNEDTIVRMKLKASDGVPSVTFIASIWGDQVTAMESNGNVSAWDRALYSFSKDNTGTISTKIKSYWGGTQHGFYNNEVTANGPIANPNTEGKIHANNQMRRMGILSALAVKAADAEAARMATMPPHQTKITVMCESPVDLSANFVPYNGFGITNPGNPWTPYATAFENGPDGAIRYTFDKQTGYASTKDFLITVHGNFDTTGIPLLALGPNKKNIYANQINETDIYNRKTGEHMFVRGNDWGNEVYENGNGYSERSQDAFRPTPAAFKFWTNKFGAAMQVRKNTGCDNAFRVLGGGPG